MAFGKGKKRSASKAAGGAKKRPAGNAQMCNVVAAELTKATALSQSCRSMLSKICKDSLTVYADERHAYQKQAVAMTGETLAGIQATLEDDIAKAQATVDSADKEKASRIQVETAAKTALDGLEEAVKSAKATVDTDSAAEKAAKAALSSAVDAVASKDAELASLTDMQGRMTVSKDAYEPLKTAKADSKKTLNALTKCLADAGLEDGLVESLETTLKKEASARGTYDGIVFHEVDSFMAQKFAELQTSIDACPPVKATLVAAKEAAEAAHVASQETLKAGHTAFSNAEVAKKEGKKAHTTAAAAVSSYDSDMAKAAKALEKANTALVAFQEGPKKCFEALKNLAPPPPEPEPTPEVEVSATTDAYGAATEGGDVN